MDYTQNTLEIHRLFFESNSELSDEEVIKMYEQNASDVVIALNSQDTFHYALRIKCEYCFALLNLKKFKQCEYEILSVIKLFESFLTEDKERFDNHFFEKIFFSLIQAQFYQSKYKRAEKNIQLLLKYKNEAHYQKWEKAIKQHSMTLRGMFFNLIYPVGK